MNPIDDLLDRAPCGFLSFGDDGIVTLVNASLLDLLGYTREEIVGRHLERIFPVGTRIFYQTHWFPLLRLKGGADEIFLLLRPREGEDIGFLVNAGRRERDGRVCYDCVLMRVQERRRYEDELLRAKRAAEQASASLERANGRLEAQATELEQQQQQLQEQALMLEETSEELRVINAELLERTEEAEHLQQVAEAANRAKSTFLAVMSHELRTPLNAIAGYVQLMEMGIHGPVTEPQLVALERISRSQQHLLRLINDVLDLARIESGRVDYAIEDVALEQVMSNVTPMVEPQFVGKGIEFTVDLLSGLRARADREKLQQILINLLANAVKFTPVGGRVRVEAMPATDAPDRLLVRVSDTGIGIPQNKLDSIFQPFMQVERKESSAAEGSGLGLSISRDLARGMGGDLTAESRIGSGSTFTLVLPLVQGLRPAPPP